jgi:hypothetical protein
MAQKPASDNDIVAALWESDFPNIQYHAPDEFVENRILAEKRDSAPEEKDLPELPSDLAHETLEVKVDLAKFSEGRIELKPEDQEKFRWGPQEEDAAGIPPTAAEGEAGPAPAASPEASSGMGVSPAASLDPHLDERELEGLESMIRTNRQIRPEEEFLNLTAEVVYLEEDRLSVPRASMSSAISSSDRSPRGISRRRSPPSARWRSSRPLSGPGPK